MVITPALQSNSTSVSAYKISKLNAILLLTMAAVTALGNIIVLITLYKDPAKELRTVSNILIANLAASDLILGLIAEPLFAATYWLVNAKVYLTTRYLIDVFLVASFLSMLALSIERYFMLKTAGMVESLFRRHHAKAATVFIWISAWLVPIAVFFLEERDSKMLIAFGVGCPVALVMFCLYIKIYRVIKHVYRKDHNRHRLLSDQDSLESSTSSVERRAETIKARELKLAWAIFAVVGIFVLCWIPGFVADTLGKVCSEKPACKLSKNMSDLMVITGFLNATLNPFIYSMSNKKFRKAFILMVIPRSDTHSMTPLIS